MKSLVKILPLLLLLGTTAVLIGGCGHDDYVSHLDLITVHNDSPWDITVEPWGVFLERGHGVDFESGDIVHVVAIRYSDGVVLADVDVAPGHLLVVE